MNKPLKIAVGLVAVLVLLLGLAYAALAWYLTDERLLALVEPPMEDALQREVSIGGVELGLFRSFPNVSVGLDSLRIHTPDGPEGPRADLASLTRLWVVVPLRPLLDRQLRVTALELVEPQVLVEVYGDLTSNLTGLMAADTAAVPEPAGASPLEEIDLERVTITDGQLGYINADGTILAVSDLDVSLAARLAETYQVQGEVQAAGIRAEAGGVTYANDLTVGLDLAAEADLTNEHLRLDATQLSVEDLLLNLRGTVAGWGQEAMQVDLAFDAPEGQVRGFWSLLPASLTRDLDGLQADGRFAVDGTLQGVLSETEIPALDIRLELADGRIQYPDVPAPIENMALAARLTNDVLTVERFHAEAAGNTLDLQAVVRTFTAPILDAQADVQADLASVQRFYPLEPDEELSGRVTIDARLAGALEQPEAIEASGVVLLDGVTYASPALAQPVRDLSGRLDLTNAAIRISDLSLKTGQSDVTFNGAVDNYMAFAAETTTPGQEPVITGRATSSFFNVTEQIPEDTTGGPIELPALRMDVTLQADTVEYDGIRLADASGRVTMQDGQIRFEQARAGLFRGVLEAEGTFDLSDPLRPAMATTVRLQDAVAASVFTDLETVNKYAQIGGLLSGLLSTEVTMGVAMDEALSPDLATAFAQGFFGVEQGGLQGLPLQERLTTYLGLDRLNPLQFRDWTHFFNVAGDQLQIRDLTLAAGDVGLTLNGTQGIDGAIDYTFTISLPPEVESTLRRAPVFEALGPVAQAVDAALVDPESGRILLDLTATGTFKEPRLGLNTGMMQARLRGQASALLAEQRARARAELDSLEAAARSRAATEVEAAREAAEGEAQRLLEDQKQAVTDQLRGLLPGQQPDSTADSTNVAAPADSLAKEAGDALKSRLRGLLKKKQNNE